MISPRPNTPAARALALVAAYPDEIDAVALARHLWPPPPQPRPTGTLTERMAVLGAWRREWYGVPPCKRTGEPGRPGRIHELERKAGRLLGRLQEAGTVESRGPVRVASWFADRVERHGMRRALSAVNVEAGTEERPSAAARMIAEVGTRPLTASELLPRRVGARVRLYRLLCERGVLVPPTARRVTDSGRQIVAAWAAREAA